MPVQDIEPDKKPLHSRHRPDKRPCNVTSYIIAFIVSAVTVLIFFSNLTEAYSSAQFKPLSVNLSSNASSTMDVTGNQLVVPAEGGEVVYENLGTEAKALEIVSHGENSEKRMVTGSVYIQDSTNAPDYALASTFKLVPNGIHNKSIVRFKSVGNVRALKIHFDASGIQYSIKQITVNPLFKVTINFGMFFLLWGISTLLVAIIRHRWWKAEFDIKKKSHNLLLFSSLAFTLGLALWIWLFLDSQSPKTVSYPLPPEARANQYLLQFEAWKHSSAALLDKPFTDLLNLENPYSAASRVGIQGVLWDFVLYGGKYYSYFGIAPLIFIYLPFNLLFPNKLPSDLSASSMLALGAIVFLFLALREIVIRFDLKPNLLLYMISFPALTAGSCIPFIQSRIVVYYIALLSAIMFGAAFIFFSFRATRTSLLFPRVMFFFGAGISLVSLLASRPTSVIVPVLFITPIFINVLVDRTARVTRKILDVSAFFIPLLAGTAGLLSYNKVRFGKWFDFGNSYQLTVNDMRSATFNFDILKLKDMFINYYGMPFSVQPNFPYISTQDGVSSGYGYYLFEFKTFGMAMLPMFWFLLFCFIKNKQTILEKACCITGVVSSILLGYFNYSIGGSLFRYFCDFLYILLLIGLVGAFRVSQYLVKGDQIHKLIYVLTICGCLITFVIGILLVFSSNLEGAVIPARNPDVYVAVSNFWSLG